LISVVLIGAITFLLFFPLSIVRYKPAMGMFKKWEAVVNELIPRISVILTAYNSESFLKDAFESVFRQTLQPTQIILVDDGSTDGTKDIAQSFDKKVLKIYMATQSGRRGCTKQRDS